MPPRTPLRATSGNIGKRKELSPYLRGKILGQHETGRSAHTISQALGIPRRTVRDTISKKGTQIEGTSKERSGRPRILTERDIRHIFQMVKKEPFITYRQLKNCIESMKWRLEAVREAGGWVIRTLNTSQEFVR
jgi:transposase